jgi:integrase
VSQPSLRVVGAEGPFVSDFLKSLPASIPDRNLPVALRCLEAWLGRAAHTGDLEEGPLYDWAASLVDRGVDPQTVDRYCHAIRRLARAAVAEGLLEHVPWLKSWRPRFKKAKTLPWSPAELSQLFAAVRIQQGTISGLPASSWWRALLLASIDLQQPAPPLLALPGHAFDSSAGTVTIGLCVYSLHPRTAAAIAELPTTSRPRLFPWELDESAGPGGNAYCMLFLDFKKILKRAGLPSGRMDLFRRLQATYEDDPEVLDKIDWEYSSLPQGVDEPPAAASMKPRRRRGNPRWAAAGELNLSAKKRKPKEGPDVYLINNPSDRTVRHFFETIYVPRRLAYGSRGSAVAFRATINRLREYCLTDCTLDALSDDLVEEFLAYWRPRRSIDSLKRMRGDLLCLWRFAWRKKRVETQPRDIDEIRVPKRLPEAWSIDELDRLLTVAGSIEGTVCGIPASLYWPALLMTAIETGLRKTPLLSLRVQHFDPERGWVRALAGTQKQKADQDLPISEQTVRLILATQPAGRELVFPWPFTDRHTLDVRLRALLRQAGLAHGRRDMWHRLRRTCATYIADVAGEAEAQKQLGHAAVQTTRRYLDVRKMRRARIIDNPELQRPTWRPRGLLGEESAP